MNSAKAAQFFILQRAAIVDARSAINILRKNRICRN